MDPKFDGAMRTVDMVFSKPILHDRGSRPSVYAYVNTSGTTITLVLC
jgi:hypothetical protein